MRLVLLHECGSVIKTECTINFVMLAELNSCEAQTIAIVELSHRTEMSSCPIIEGLSKQRIITERTESCSSSSTILTH
jgi:hypothetical protein